MKEMQRYDYDMIGSGVEAFNYMDLFIDYEVLVN